jgi:hypothetical protein
MMRLWLLITSLIASSSTDILVLVESTQSCDYQPPHEVFLNFFEFSSDWRNAVTPAIYYRRLLLLYCEAGYDSHFEHKVTNTWDWSGFDSKALTKNKSLAVVKGFTEEQLSTTYYCCRMKMQSLSCGEAPSVLIFRGSSSDCQSGCHGPCQTQTRQSKIEWIHFLLKLTCWATKHRQGHWSDMGQRIYVLQKLILFSAMGTKVFRCMSKATAQAGSIWN